MQGVGISVSVLPELLPVALTMALAGETGFCNFVNAGHISPDDLALLGTLGCDLQPSGFLLPLELGRQLPNERLTTASQSHLRNAMQAIRHHVPAVVNISTATTIFTT